MYGVCLEIRFNERDSTLSEYLSHNLSLLLIKNIYRAGIPRRLECQVFFSPPPIFSAFYFFPLFSPKDLLIVRIY